MHPRGCSGPWRSLTMPVNLDQHRVVDVRAERALNGVEIGLVAVGRELDAIGDAVGNVLHEPRGAIAIATADEMRNDQFRLGFDCRPSPSVASAIRSGFSSLATFFCFA